ncbi:unnamed protein product [Dibothriocephalus latus]|uniref:Reverse transcriptase domain-containing protein n=1 Tax=Dibothriocephalus latus TaxID=60516 RepID=A0A3P7L2Y1_DIBLA|nr:unnamed protein product [Dibothriocephalus latus]
MGELAMKVLMGGQDVSVSTRMPTTTVHDLLFVNNCALNTETEEDIQWCTALFAAGRANFGLTFNIDKTLVMHPLVTTEEYCAPRINVNAI